MTRSASLPAQFLLLSAAFCACTARTPKSFTIAGTTMGTTYHVTVAGWKSSPAQRSQLKFEVEGRLEQIDALMSTYKPKSEVSRFNRSKSRAPFAVSAETLKVVSEALRFSEMSGGAFDPTVGRLVDLWGFGPTRRSGPPKDSAVAAALKTTGYKRLTTRKSPPALIKAVPELEIDLSAIAKGYGADAVAEALKSRGIKDFLVEVGGEVVAAGMNVMGEPWRIGIDKPKEGALPGDELSAVVPLSGAAMATSGSYRNFIKKGGKRLPHFIDPRTGRPVTHSMVSATVTAPTCLEADAAATVLMVLGPERSREWLKANPRFNALLISLGPDGAFQQWTTRGFPEISR